MFHVESNSFVLSPLSCPTETKPESFCLLPFYLALLIALMSTHLSLFLHFPWIRLQQAPMYILSLYSIKRTFFFFFSRQPTHPFIFSRSWLFVISKTNHSFCRPPHFSATPNHSPSRISFSHTLFSSFPHFTVFISDSPLCNPIYHHHHLQLPPRNNSPFSFSLFLPHHMPDSLAGSVL